LLPVATEGRDLGIRDLYFHYPHYHHSRPAVALRRGEYKLIRFFDESDPELYNLAEDIGEQRNLASVEVDRTRRMLADLNAWLERTAAPLPVDNPDFDAERRAEWGPRPK
jgi:uncharacterized sulfatase